MVGTRAQLVSVNTMGQRGGTLTRIDAATGAATASRSTSHQSFTAQLGAFTAAVPDRAVVLALRRDLACTHTARRTVNGVIMTLGPYSC